MSQAVTVPLAAVVRVVQQGNLGEPHPVLAGGERYHPPHERPEPLVQHDFVHDALALVRYADTEYYGWVDAGSGAWAILLAGLRDRGVLVVRDGARVTLRRVRRDRLVPALLDRLPRTPAGRGTAISVRAEDFHRHQGGVAMRAARAARPHGARQLDALLAAPRLGAGKLYAAARDRDGHRVRAADWVTYLDVEQYGRWLVYAGSGSVTAVPGTPERLAAKLTELAGGAAG